MIDKIKNSNEFYARDCKKKIKTPGVFLHPSLSLVVLSWIVYLLLSRLCKNMTYEQNQKNL
jgi:hypothetical protein